MSEPIISGLTLEEAHMVLSWIEENVSSMQTVYNGILNSGHTGTSFGDMILNIIEPVPVFGDEWGEET